MKNRMRILLFILVSLSISCGINNSESVDYYNIPTYSENNKIQAVIEIPAGTNHKYEFNHESGEFDLEIRNGKHRVVDFLPYVVNYGFIPSTYMDPKIGGDGDPLDILVISESFPTGSVIEIKPIGIMMMVDDEEKDYKIIAVPTSSDDAIIDADNLEELKEKYPEIMSIIELWFKSYKHNDAVKIEGWGDENAALAEIKKWQINLD